MFGLLSCYVTELCKVKTRHVFTCILYISGLDVGTALYEVACAGGSIG